MKLIVDTDIGDDIDDAFAIRFLDECEEIEWIGITTVYKNTSQRAKIAKKLTGRKIPVYAGENKPLQRDVRLLLGEKIGENGLIDIDHFSDAAKNEICDGDDAVDFILSQLKKYPNEITILAIGSLTNLAKAILRDREVFCLVNRLVIMGGRFKEEIPEWNIETDPEAARIVFKSEVNTVLVPYDVTILCDMSKDEVDAVRQAVGEKNAYLASMMDRWIEHYDPNWDGKEKLPVLHDLLVAESLADETVCTYTDIKFDLHDDGCTVKSTNGDYSVKVAVSVDAVKFKQGLYAIIGKADGASTVSVEEETQNGDYYAVGALLNAHEGIVTEEKGNVRYGIFACDNQNRK